MPRTDVHRALPQMAAEDQDPQVSMPSGDRACVQAARWAVCQGACAALSDLTTDTFTR